MGVAVVVERLGAPRMWDFFQDSWLRTEFTERQAEHKPVCTGCHHENRTERKTRRHIGVMSQACMNAHVDIRANTYTTNTHTHHKSLHIRMP